MIAVPDSVGEVLYSPLGHFLVGDDTFYSNRDALEASKRVQLPAKWNYFDQVWANAHAAGVWRQQSLTELYRVRARQLREQYDYVGVLFSGGWDSRNIIETFAAEGLHIDDIITFVTPELESTTAHNDQSASNWYGEIMYHAVPYAEQYSHNHPSTGVIKIEWLDRVEFAFQDAEAVMRDSRPKPGVFFGRWLSVASNAELEKRIGGRRACLLLGLDKPCVIQNTTTAKAFFPEGLLRLYSYCTKGNGFPDHVTWEPFYWTPNLPELAIRGWYELLDLCRKDPAVNIAHSLDQSIETRNTAKMSRYVQDAMRQRLYPGFDPRAWQANKQSDFGFFMEFELPILRVLEQRNRHLRSVLGEVLNETAARINESDLQLGDQTRNGLTPWVDKSIHDGHTVLDYKSFLSPMIDLDTNFGRP